MLLSPLTVILRSAVASRNLMGNWELLASATGGAEASSSIFALPAAIDVGSIMVVVTTLNIVGGVGGSRADPGATNATEASRAASQALAKLRAPAAGSVVGARVSSCAWNIAALKVKRNPTATNTLESGSIGSILAAYQELKLLDQLESATGGSAANVLFHVPTGSSAIISRP